MDELWRKFRPGLWTLSASVRSRCWARRSSASKAIQGMVQDIREQPASRGPQKDTSSMPALRKRSTYERFRPGNRLGKGCDSSLPPGASKGISDDSSHPQRGLLHLPKRRRLAVSEPGTPYKNRGTSMLPGAALACRSPSSSCFSRSSASRALWSTGRGSRRPGMSASFGRDSSRRPLSSWLSLRSRPSFSGRTQPLAYRFKGQGGGRPFRRHSTRASRPFGCRPGRYDRVVRASAIAIAMAFAHPRRRAHPRIAHRQWQRRASGT